MTVTGAPHGRSTQNRETSECFTKIKLAVKLPRHWADAEKSLTVCYTSNTLLKPSEQGSRTDF